MTNELHPELSNFTHQSAMSTSSNGFPEAFYQYNGKPILQKPIMLLPDTDNHTYSQQNIDDMLELHNQLVEIALPNRPENKPANEPFSNGCADDGAAAEAKSTKSIEDLKHDNLQIRHIKSRQVDSKQADKFKLSIPEEFTWETSRDITIGTKTKQQTIAS